MVDPAEAIGKARKAVTDRAELPGMSLMEHLDELRRRIVHSAAYLAAGFIIAWFFRNYLLHFLQAPLLHIGKSLVFTHPMDALNLYLQVALLGGAILASPFILYQVWLFIAPGPLSEGTAIRGPVHGRHRRPVSGRRQLRILLCAAGSDQDPDPGVRARLHPDGDHRGLQRILPLR